MPDNPEFMLYLGSFYEEKEEFEKAENVLKKGLEIDSDNTSLHFRLGVVYDKWGRKEASIEEMKTVISLDPLHANALNYLGYTYAELGENLDEAERLIKAALKQKPDDGYITDSLGWVYYKKGHFIKALKYLEKAVNIVPDDPIILEHLGDAYLKISDKKKALQFYRRSLLKKEKDKADLEKKIQELTGKKF
jgi:tetratricopeptide (TPR) repeat protein